MGEKNLQQSPSENAAFWLPSHFLTDDDFLLDDPTPKSYGFGPDPFDSPLSSPDTNDEFLSDLTRHLAHSSLLDHHQKPWGISTSPQSTLTGFGPWKSNRSGFTSNGSPNGPSSQVPSPPLTPDIKTDAAWDLLYEAAGQVARLKMSALAAQMSQHQHSSRGGLLPPPRHHHNLYDFSQGKKQGVWAQQERETWSCHNHNQHQENGWPALVPRHQQRGVQARGMYVGGGVKRQSTGTGVFLPRRVTGQHHHAEPPLKKPSGCPTVLLPARVVQALNNNLDDSSHSRFGSAFTDHEIMMARRNAILSQQRRNMRTENAATMLGHDIRLPTDWTY